MIIAQEEGRRVVGGDGRTGSVADGWTDRARTSMHSSVHLYQKSDSHGRTDLRLSSRTAANMPRM